MFTSDVRLEAIYEILSLAVQISFNVRNILKHESGHGYTLLQDALNCVVICVRIHDKLNPERTRTILDDLEIAYLLPEDTLFVPEDIAKQRPSAPIAVDKSLLRSSDNGAHMREVIGGTLLGPGYGRPPVSYRMN